MCIVQYTFVVYLLTRSTACSELLIELDWTELNWTCKWPELQYEQWIRVRVREAGHCVFTMWKQWAARSCQQHETNSTARRGAQPPVTRSVSSRRFAPRAASRTSSSQQLNILYCTALSYRYRTNNENSTQRTSFLSLLLLGVCRVLLCGSKAALVTEQPFDQKALLWGTWRR